MMRILQEFPYKNYCQLVLFTFYHWGRLCLEWLHTLLVAPLESFIQQYLKHEPYELTWVQVYRVYSEIYVTESDEEKPFFHSEEAYCFPYTHDFEQFLEQEYEQYLESPHIPSKHKGVPYESRNPHLHDTLFMARNDDAYYIRTFPSCKTIPKEATQVSQVFKPSDVEFLMVEYHHPEMTNPIQIHVPESHYQCGNELFSPSYILRYLELQTYYYVYDLEYTIKILDHNVEQLTLTSNQYLRIEEDKYAILQMHLDSDSDSDTENEDAENEGAENENAENEDARVSISDSSSGVLSDMDSKVNNTSKCDTDDNKSLWSYFSVW